MNLKYLISKIIFSVLCLTTSVYAQTMDAGRIDGELDVSANGAATYSILIDVPPSISGVAPQRALTYSNQAGNDLADYRWNIRGVIETRNRISN